MTVEDRSQSDDLLAGLTEDQRKQLARQYLEGASHDELKSIPVYNQRYQQVISAAHDEASKAREQSAQERQQNDQLDQWENWLYRQNTPEKRAEILSNSAEAAQANAMILQRRNHRPQDDAAVYRATEAIITGFETELKTDPNYEDFDWDNWRKETSPAKAMRMLNEHGAKKLTPGREQMREEMEALLNERLTRNGAGRVQPDILPPPQGGGPGRMTREQFDQMSMEKRAEFRKTNTDEYDAMVGDEIARREQLGRPRLDQVRR
jgi:hypothetical protein